MAKNTKENTGFFEAVYEAVKTIPQGKVASYGQIAAMIGRPRAARFVGYALHVNPYYGIVPCHRIVNRDGYLAGGFAFGGIDIQKDMLEKEGVTVSHDYVVDMKKFCYQP